MLDQISQIARYAGQKIMKFYYSKKLINISYKLDKTPVTNVDYIASKIIKKELTLITPKIPIISEEEFFDFNICRNWNYYWLIDPLDGTKEFLNRNGEFTVNISLIDNGCPVLGVIYAPFFDVLYSANNTDAWKEKKIGIKEKIHVLQSVNPLLITSRSHPDKELLKYITTIKNYKIKKLGSSLKFALIAEGSAQIYPRFGSTHIWDTAAGHAIVNAAGGKIITWKNQNLNYLLSSRDSFINPGFCVSVV